MNKNIFKKKRKLNLNQFEIKDVRILSNEYRMAEERYHKLNSQKLFSLALQKRAQDEIKLITSKSTNEKSFR